jgi:HD-GYP domain-containing protein (c-di-GMP phosphodiesterase class II)
MVVNYKKELESAAKGMILVHEPNVLIKMIVRMIVQKVKVTHAGILLYTKDTDSYVLTVSRGPSGLRIPPGFARMDSDNPLIRFFRQKKHRNIFSNGAFDLENAKKLLKKKINPGLKRLVKGAMYQMEMFDTVTCIPSYHRDDLLGLLLLGKKKNVKGFAQDELDFFIALASDVAMAIRNAQLFRELETELDKKQRLFIHTTVALAAAIDAKDHYTHGHTTRVTNLCLEIAKRLKVTHKKTLDAKFLEHLQIAGLLHDIGKIGIPEAILNKEGPLEEQERIKMREHPVVGATILEPIKELDLAILGVKYHHEHYDGSGYPEGLKGDQIPLIAAIISVADTFDAMITDRPYRHGMTKHDAIQEVLRVSGKQLNPEVTVVFFDLYKENKI